MADNFNRSLDKSQTDTSSAQAGSIPTERSVPMSGQSFGTNEELRHDNKIQPDSSGGTLPKRSA